MKIKCAFLLGISVLASGYALAAAPPLRVVKTIHIDASAGKVWKLVQDFNGLNTWHPAVAADEILEGTNNTVGAVRLLTLKGGGTIREKLLAFNPTARAYKYAILEGVLPVSSYTSTMVVSSTGKGKSLSPGPGGSSARTSLTIRPTMKMTRPRWTPWVGCTRVAWII